MPSIYELAILSNSQRVSSSCVCLRVQRSTVRGLVCGRAGRDQSASVESHVQAVHVDGWGPAPSRSKGVRDVEVPERDTRRPQSVKADHSRRRCSSNDNLVAGIIRCGRSSNGQCLSAYDRDSFRVGTRQNRYGGIAAGLCVGDGGRDGRELGRAILCNSDRRC